MSFAAKSCCGLRGLSARRESSVKWTRNCAVHPWRTFSFMGAVQVAAQFLVHFTLDSRLAE